jgi:hypothetical protein
MNIFESCFSRIVKLRPKTVGFEPTKDSQYLNIKRTRLSMNKIK